MSEKVTPVSASVSRQAILDACLHADWMQVVLNQGPPCFHLEGMIFCLRAERWAGHDGDPHKFVSLHELVRALLGSHEQTIKAADALFEALCPKPGTTKRENLKAKSAALAQYKAAGTITLTPLGMD